MKYSGAYAIVLILHLLAVIFLIGPLGIAGTLSARWVKDKDLSALRSAHRTTTVYSFASILVPVIGAALVSIKIHGVKVWSMSDAWVGASVALFIVALGVSLLVIAPAQKKAITEIESEPREDSVKTLGLLEGRLQAASGVQMAAWLIIVVLMVTKPGS